MEFSVQAENLVSLREALKSDCDRIRFGSEFCEYKIPSMKMLDEAYALTSGSGKDFVYATPRVSDSSVERLREQLAFLNGVASICVVVNDLGVLGILEEYGNLRPHLGRQLIYIPARCPWPEITEHEISFLKKRRVKEIFYQTSLNYLPTIDFFKGYGVRGIDVDWIPNVFPHFKFLVKNGLGLSVHLHLAPVTTTRRCHTARFVGEKDLETCSRPCYTRVFTIENEILGAKLILDGNTVFRKVEPSKNDIKRLESQITELVVTMTPATKIENKQEIDSLIRFFNPRDGLEHELLSV